MKPKENKWENLSVTVGGYTFYKRKKTDTIWWVEIDNMIGSMLFTFDKKKIYSLWQDYPQNLSPEEKRIFDEENPYWKKRFARIKKEND